MDLCNQIVTALEALGHWESTGKGDTLPSEQYREMAIDTPAVRRLARQFSREFRVLAWHNQISLVQRLLEQGSNKAAHLGVFLLGLSVHDSTFVDAVALDSMVGAFRGWSVTDAFCIEVMQPLLERFTSDVLSLTADWATSECLWKRRASVVVFARKIGASGDYTHDGLAACDRLIADCSDLVRKGVGWALKDLMRGDRDPVLAYVISLRKRGVSSVITLYALRDITGAERKRILAIKP
jgi:3-methyladenine DNA glycosylase AlkD